VPAALPSSHGSAVARRGLHSRIAKLVLQLHMEQDSVRVTPAQLSGMTAFLVAITVSVGLDEGSGNSNSGGAGAGCDGCSGGGSNGCNGGGGSAGGGSGGSDGSSGRTDSSSTGGEAACQVVAALAAVTAAHGGTDELSGQADLLMPVRHAMC
jgi:hypothetical protein